MNWDNYDSWKISYPPEWDYEYVLDGIVDECEVELEHENKVYLATVSAEVNNDVVESVTILELVSVDEEDNEYEYKEEDFKYYTKLFSNADIKKKILDDNQDNDKLLKRIM